jgi:hypothetical protein
MMTIKDKPSLIVGGALIVVAVIAGFAVRASAGEPGAAPLDPPAGTLSTADARAEIDYIQVLDRSTTAPKYDRDAFGKAWTDVDGNRCDTRDDILARDAQRSGGTFQRSGRCTVIAIAMTEPYAGKRVTEKSKLDIDHVVPLKVAWVSGAYQWAPRVRLNLANDPRNLLAVDDDTNQHAKGDKTPDRWQPDGVGRCEYARMYVTVLKAYELPALAATRTTLADTLRGCP